MNFCITTIFLALSLISLTVQDYIRSNELILNDNLEIGSEIINLNKLISQEKVVPNDSNYLFKIVKDTVLVNYIDLEYLNSQTSLIVLKKRLNFEDICDSVAHQIESIISCSQTLKIVAVNENDFIEIPIEIRKINENLLVKKRAEISLNFSPSNLNLNISSLDSSFLIDPPLILAQEQDDSVYLRDKLLFKITSLDLDYPFQLSLETNSSLKKLKLNIVFNTEKSLIKAYDLGTVFRFSLDSYLPENMSDLYELNNNTTQSIFVRVSELKKLNLKPLDFEYPIYSIAVENNNLNLYDLLLQPRLKDISLNRSEIVFSLYQNEASLSGLKFPFHIEESSGAIRLSRQIWDEDDDFSSKNLNKLFQFGIKATYKMLSNSKKSDKTNYYYDYMIPAFAKVQITIRRESIQSPNIRAEIISPFISKYEILNEESSNQTFIFYINDPFPFNSNLVNFFIDTNKNNLSASSLKWAFDEDKTQFLLDTINATSLILLNKFEFKDQQIYKTKIKLTEMVRNQRRQRVLSELNIEFRIDFDPLIFEKQEYSLSLSQSDLIDQNLIKIKLKDRLKSKLDQQNMDNVSYRLANTEDSAMFEINSINGWLSAKRVLAAKNSYELQIIALNTDLQKSASVKLKINLNCSKLGKQVDTLQFSLFENSPNRTQIGTFRSICTSYQHSYSYELDSSLSLRLCPKSEITNCKLFDLDFHKLNRSELFILDSENGYLMTNNLINLNLLTSLVRDDYFASFDDLNLVYDMNYFSILQTASVKNSLSLNLKYMIEILVQSVPKLLNFNANLILSQSMEKHESAIEKKNKCFYNYKFSTESLNDGLDTKSSIWPIPTLISRFVRIDHNSAHLEAEFKVSECLAKFFIHNNGCLTIRDEHLFNNKCSRKLVNKNETVILKSGTYSLEFKLCFYNNNKVSCSQFYNQTLYISADLNANSKIITSIQPEADKLRLMNQDNDKPFDLLKKSNLNFFIIVLCGLIGLVAVAAIVSLIVIFAKPKYNPNIKSPSEKALVLPVKREINFKSLELSCDDGNRTPSSSNTPHETSSDAVTTSSKISKSEDNEDEMKIQVVDDYVSTGGKNFTSIKYGYANNNFSYAGSFSSIGSSYESNLIDDGLKIKNSPRGENEQGLYSVKNASIQFNNQNQSNDSNLANANEYNIYDSSCLSTELNNGKQRLNIEQNVYNCVLASANYSNSNLQLNHLQSNLQQFNQPKTSSLKKLKKEIALKKANYSNLSKPESPQGYNSMEKNNNILYESSYGYLNNKEVLLNPDEIIASVV